ncbi:MAG: hypothetical protein ACE5R6_15920 [Candidatus Heimdallarchaeota archaeon]
MRMLVRIRYDGLNHRKMIILWFFILSVLTQEIVLATVDVEESWFYKAPILTAKIGELPTIQWNQTYGGSKDDYAAAVIQTTNRGFLIVGSTLSYGITNYNAWLVKTDPQGAVEWTQTFGGSKYEEGNAVIETKDGGYVFIGSTESYGAGEIDFWLVKTDAKGNMEWQQTYGGPMRDGASGVIETDDGFFLIGSTRSYGAGGIDVLFVKTDAKGNMEWQQTYGGPEIDVIRSFIMTSDGGFAFFGYTSSFGAGGWDSWLVKTDAKGNMEWQQTYGNSKDDAAWAGIQTVGDGGYVLIGYTQSYGMGSRDFWMIKTDAYGIPLFNQTFGGIAYDEAWAGIETDGGFVLVGSTWSFGTGAGDAWLVKTDINGNMEWQQTYGGAEDDEVRSFTKATDSSFVLGGFTSSFGAGERDAWLVKVVPPGVDLTDTDGDGLTNKEEVEIYKTNPTDEDSDNDTYSDGEEISALTDPKDPLDYPKTTLSEVSGGNENSFGSIIKIGVLIVIFVVAMCFLIVIPQYFRWLRYKRALRAYSQGEGSVEEIAKRFYIPVHEMERILREHGFENIK